MLGSFPRAFAGRRIARTFARHDTDCAGRPSETANTVPTHFYVGMRLARANGHSRSPRGRFRRSRAGTNRPRRNEDSSHARLHWALLFFVAALVAAGIWRARPCGLGPDL